MKPFDFGGIDPPAESLYKEPIILDGAVFPPCRVCGQKHGYGMEDTRTGVITPLDICEVCFWNQAVTTKKEPHD
jgi:hypothetical protein